MYKLKFSLILFFLISAFLTNGQNNLVLQSNNHQFVLNDKGQIAFWGLTAADKKSKGFLLKDSVSYLLRIKKFTELNSRLPQKVSWKKNGSGYTIDFNFGDVAVGIHLTKKSEYFTAEVITVKGEDQVELLQFGKIFSALDQKIGLSVGSTYDNNHAIGLMGLNLKSSGGFEATYRERFGNAAQKLEKTKGAVLEGYTRNRSKAHMETNFLQKKINAVPVADGDAKLIGAKFALYATSTNKLLDLIEKIEINENLPHLSHNKEWIKKSLYSTSSQFNMSYNVDNIDKCLDIAEEAGITNVYHPNIFKTWGTFLLDEKKFPEGAKSVGKCSDKAFARNMNLGAHVLTNFITTNDPLISPVPDPNLQLAGTTSLKNPISATDTTLFLNNIDLADVYGIDDVTKYPKDLHFREYNNNRNREVFAVRLGNEIIEYTNAIVENNTIKLIHCKRGAFGTKAASHQSGIKAGRLVSHGYKVFFANINLQDRVATNLANFFNEGKLKRISFDGIEGANATGHNRYGGERFVDVFFKHLKDPNIVANSSDVLHYAWHYFSNESWGEPWWAKSFKESQLDHRLRSQKALAEDLLPRKMGQFSIKDNTKASDINWIMGLCAGYDAGVDFYVSPNLLEKNAEGKKILATIKQWESVRMKKTLSDEQKEKLRDTYTIYQLTGTIEQPKIEVLETWAPELGKMQGDKDRVTLAENLLNRKPNTIISYDYNHINQITEPGLPTHSNLQFYNIGTKQSLKFALRISLSATDNVKGFYLKLGVQKISIPFVLQAGDYVLYDDDQILKHFGSNGSLKKSMNIESFTINHGANTIEVDYNAIENKAGPEVIVNFKVDK